MPIIAAVVGGGLGLLGSGMQASSARSAARTAANAEIEAARIAAEEARFRPVGVSTRFGSSQFTMGPDGRLQSAGYTLSPELKAYQDQLSRMTGAGLSQAEAAQAQYQPLTGAASNLFNLGQQYLAQSPEEVAQKYMTNQLDLLAPQRERQYAQLQNQLFNTGRAGLAVGATGTRPGGGAGLSAANPELEAYYNAIAQQDAGLAAQAQEAGQRQLAFGTTLFGTGSNLLNQYQQGQVGALAPYEAYLSGMSNLESLGQQALSLGAGLGGGNTASAQALLSGGQRSAQTMLPANMLNPTADFVSNLSNNKAFMSGVNQLFGNYSLTPADKINLAQWNANQSDYLSPGYTGP
jgi:hypothetical protein